MEEFLRREKSRRHRPNAALGPMTISSQPNEATAAPLNAHGHVGYRMRPIQLRRAPGDLQALPEPPARTIDFNDDKVRAGFLGGVELAEHVLLQSWADFAVKIDNDAVLVRRGVPSARRSRH